MVKIYLGGLWILTLLKTHKTRLKQIEIYAIFLDRHNVIKYQLFLNLFANVLIFLRMILLSFQQGKLIVKCIWRTYKDSLENRKAEQFVGMDQVDINTRISETVQ